jgi:hypothetical protein
MSDPGVTFLDNDVAFTGIPEPQTTRLLVLGLILVFAIGGRRRLARAVKCR